MGALADLVGSVLGSWWRDRAAMKQMQSHPVIGPTLRTMGAALGDKNHPIGKNWSKKGKERLLLQMLERLEKVLLNPEPIRALRYELLASMIECAQLDVLIIQPPGTFPGVSGELTPYLPEIAKLDGPIKTLFYQVNPSPITREDMWDVALGRYWVAHLTMNTLNTARILMRDWNEDRLKDWFKPAYVALCVWSESQYRQKLGLPNIVKGDNPEMRLLSFSTWVNIIDSDSVAPRLEWDENWRKAFNEPSPFEGFG